MSREGQTLTRTMGFETKQHELFGIDLGDGAPRRMLVWGALCCAIWWGLLYVIFRGFNPMTMFFWLAPPVFLAYYGWRDGRTHRRRKVTEWVLTARWLRRGSEPVIALGRRKATRAERMGLVERWGHRFGHDDPIALINPRRAAPERRHERPSPAARTSAPLGRTHTVQLTSTETAAAQWQAVLDGARRRRTLRPGRHRRDDVSVTTPGEQP
ncbi:MAG: hypothetical protein L0H79_15800 [Intrasporangium sp.]|uniref:hypothetical protein n=1 Tax=Intrasporangium sp. TaxID=1925024 RepID=UPI002647F6EB|nr:hypothetical protein [Intrasporangium sp.]MDN5797200.1 hypothetical protein [Intrasporangium sp.]